MTKLTKQNVAGTDYTMVGCTLTGVSATSADTFLKVIFLSDGDIVADGMTVVCTFANGNTAGNAPDPITIYSSDQVHYYSDSGLTQAFTLAPEGCYEITYTGTGNAYEYISYPVFRIGDVAGPLCDAKGHPVGGELWEAGDVVMATYSGGKFLMASSAAKTSEAAERLETARNLKVALGSTTAQSFDGSANAESIGVSGTLPVSNGGTGQTDLADVNVGSATSSGRVSATNITIKTGSTAQAKISLNTLMTWLMHNDRKYIPSSVSCYKIITTSWSYANNDILQLTIDGVNYELQLAGVVIEFMGNATDYQTGMFRLRIHSSPTTFFTATSNYTIFPVNHIAEYTCNGSSYSPTWEMLLGVGDSARALSGTYTCSTAAATAAKTVTVPGFKLAKGARLTIVLSNANTAASALTMNVNGTGAKTIRWNGTVTSTSTYAMTATTYMCYYDGTYWDMDSGFEAYSARIANGPNGVSSAQAFGALAYCGTAAATAAKTASCYGYKLIIGQPFKIYVGTANTASSPTLNIASTGAKSIFIDGVAASTSNLVAGWYVGIYDGNYYQLYSTTNSVLPSSGCAVCHTAAGTAAKVASMPYFKLQSGTTFELVIVNANSSASAITLNINGTGAKTLYINNTVSSASNYTLPAGTYLCRYNGSYYYIDTGYFVTNARNANHATDAGSATDAYYLSSGRGAVNGYYINPSYDSTNNWVKLNGFYGTGTFNSRNSCADVALKIRTATPSSPADGDIWIE